MIHILLEILLGFGCIIAAVIAIWLVAMFVTIAVLVIREEEKDA